MSKRVPVGVGVVVIRQGQLLIGHRKGGHGAATWALPGGWLESDDETIEHCAMRELQEETGLVAISLRVLDLAPYKQNMDGVHSVSVYVLANTDHSHQPEIRETDKCAEWRWVGLKSEIPAMMPLFPALKHALSRRHVLLEAESMPE